MPVSKAQQRATAKYEAKVYDKLLLRLPKGQKEIIQGHAAAVGESVNAFIGRAITEAMERDSAPQEAAGAPAGVGVVSLSHEAVKTAQEAADAAGEDIPQFIERAIQGQAERDVDAREASARIIEHYIDLLKSGTLPDKSREMIEEILIQKGITPPPGDNTG